MTEKMRKLWSTDEKNWECMVSKWKTTGTKKSPKTRAKDTKKGLDSAYLLW